MRREGVPKCGIRGLQERPFTGINIDGIGFSNGDLHTPIIPWAGITRWGFCTRDNLDFHPDLIRLHTSPPDDMILVDNLAFMDMMIHPCHPVYHFLIYLHRWQNFT